MRAVANRPAAVWTTFALPEQAGIHRAVHELQGGLLPFLACILLLKLPQISATCSGEQQGSASLVMREVPRHRSTVNTQCVRASDQAQQPLTLVALNAGLTE